MPGYGQRKLKAAVFQLVSNDVQVGIKVWIKPSETHFTYLPKILGLNAILSPTIKFTMIHITWLALNQI
ncbi:hypothetical protein BJI46_05510 [Acinetobacter qingfengensis]|uniref:Uncharacterized protein n=1 Tax=Acinetobacter qingfengensis TaxID=1262585 RepID=A0A1E7QYS1_9GAMM|nr:hypothetical protein BJI46_05510 [Acinetobacter qingfengensis]